MDNKKVNIFSLSLSLPSPLLLLAQGVEVTINASNLDDIDPLAIGQRLTNGTAALVASPVLSRLKTREEEHKDVVRGARGGGHSDPILRFSRRTNRAGLTFYYFILILALKNLYQKGKCS